MVGAGRALTRRRVGRDGSITGASASLANAALRQRAEPGDRDEVQEALLGIARQFGVIPERLRLFDYEQARGARPDLPTVAVVLATFGTWKAARAAAARTAGE